ncbi:MAG TPA: MarR family transcriptional regulator [Nakamurella sp.]
MNARWLDEDEQAAWRAWLDMYRLLLPAFDKQLSADSRASFTDFEVLVHLSEAPDLRLRMSEVAQRTVSTRSAITRTVDRLVAREWVRRVRSDVDQRGFFAELTPLGSVVLSEIAPGHVEAVRDYLIDLLTEPELAALRSIGQKVRLRMAGRPGAG